jgi:hypothetical protein
MSRIPDIKRLLKEDFDPDNQELIGKIAYPLNTFIDQSIFLFNKNLDFQNLAQEVRTITVETDGSAAIQNPPNILTNIPNRRIQGIICIKADNLTNGSVYATSQPFVSFTINGSTVIIQNVSGLTTSSRWQLRLLLFGESQN